MIIRIKPSRAPSALALIGLITISSAPAHAEGTLGLGEVLLAVERVPKLVTEINAELGKAQLRAENVTCIAARHGNHWSFLGGARAAPYECRIGQRTLLIEADRIYLDSRGKALGDLDRADPKQARTFSESNFRWTWKR
jgi:hypothetical protein